MKGNDAVFDGRHRYLKNIEWISVRECTVCVRVCVCVCGVCLWCMLLYAYKYTAITNGDELNDDVFQNTNYHCHDSMC